MDVNFSNIPPAPRYTCWGWVGLLEKPITSLKRPSPPAATCKYSVRYFALLYIFFRFLFPKNLKTSIENCWVLWFPPIYSESSFGQRLAYVAFVILLFFHFASKWRRYGKKDGSWRSFGFSFDVMTTRTKLKNNTPNALSSPYAMIAIDCAFFSRKRNFARFSSLNRKQLILTVYGRFFCQSSCVFLGW